MPNLSNPRPLQRPTPLSPRDALHLAALRGAKRRAEDLNVRGKRRDEVIHTYLIGAANTAYYLMGESAEDLIRAANLHAIHGYREVLTQLHVLEGRR